MSQEQKSPVVIKTEEVMRGRAVMPAGGNGKPSNGSNANSMVCMEDKLELNIE